MKQRHNSHRRRHKTAKKHKTASLGSHKDETGRGRDDTYRNVRFTVKRPSNRLSAWQKFKTAVGLHKPKYPTRMGITSVGRGRKRRRHKKTKKHRRHKNEAGRGREEWNRLNDTYNTIHEQELHAQAEIDKADQIMRHQRLTKKKYDAAMKTRTKYEDQLRTLNAAANAAREAKEQEELKDPYSELS